MARMALRTKQLLGLQPSAAHKSFQANGLQHSCAGEEDARSGGWAIAAFFKSPRGQSGGSSSLPSVLLRPLAAIGRRRGCRQQQEQRPADGPSGGSCARQTALSIQTFLQENPAVPAVPLEQAAAEGVLDSVQCSSTEPALPGRQSRLRRLAAPPLPLPEMPDSLDAVLAELKAARMHAGQQAALLQEVRAGAADVWHQVHDTAAQLAQCRGRMELEERLLAEVEAALERDTRQVDAQAAALEAELQAQSASASAELQRLQAATRRAVRHAAGMADVAAERAHAAATWKHRCDLMAKSHQPLTPDEQQRFNANLREYYTRNA